jgi:hypothetical protein
METYPAFRCSITWPPGFAVPIRMMALPTVFSSTSPLSNLGQIAVQEPSAQCETSVVASLRGDDDLPLVGKVIDQADTGIFARDPNERDNSIEGNRV